MKKILDNCVFPVCDDPGPDTVGKCLLYAQSVTSFKTDSAMYDQGPMSQGSPHMDRSDISQALRVCFGDYLA